VPHLTWQTWLRQEAGIVSQLEARDDRERDAVRANDFDLALDIGGVADRIARKRPLLKSRRLVRVDQDDGGRRELRRCKKKVFQSQAKRDAGEKRDDPLCAADERDDFPDAAHASRGSWDFDALHGRFRPRWCDLKHLRLTLSSRRQKRRIAKSVLAALGWADTRLAPRPQHPYDGDSSHA